MTTAVKPGRIFAKPRVMAPRTQSSNPAVSILGNGGSISKLYQGYEERQQQLDLSAFIWDAINSDQHAAGEAGTGVGKSFAYLVPMILSRRPSVVAVPTIALQTQLIEKDLPALSQPGVFPFKFTYALLKGRGNYLCRYKADQFVKAPEFESREDRAAWPAIAEWIETTRDGDTGKLTVALPMAIKTQITTTSDECLGESCPMYSDCDAERAKAVASASDIIVTNMSLLMLDLELRASSNGIASILPDREIIGLDEAHQLRERAVSAATREVHLGRFEYIARRIEQLARKADAVARKNGADAQAAEMIRAAEEDREPVSVERRDVLAGWTKAVSIVRREITPMFDHYVLRLEESKKSALRLGDEFDIAYEALIGLGTFHEITLSEIPPELDESDRKGWEKMAETLGTLVSDLAACILTRNSNEVRAVSLDDKGRAVLSVAPIDVSDWLRARLWNASLVRPARREDGSYDFSVCKAVRAFAVSATIVDDKGSLGYFRQTVGLDTCREIVVGSPFPYAQNGLLYIPTDGGFDSSVARKERRTWVEYLDRMTAEYERLITISGGRAFALFTSNEVLNYVHSRLKNRLPFTVLRQGELPQAELVRRFKDDGRAVLFGVKSYWEGVDVQGAALSMVIISGMPFTPPDDPHYAARCERLDRREGRGASFRKISIPEATIALKQGYGRGIRSATDTACVCILDARLRFRQYGPGIVAALPPSPVVGDHAAVEAFFQRIG